MSGTLPRPVPDAGLLTALRTAVEAENAPGLVSELLVLRDRIPQGTYPAEFRMRDVIRDLSPSLRGRAIQEVMARGEGRDVAVRAGLSRLVSLLAEHDDPGRRSLLLDLQLYGLHPESLRAPVRVALLADAAVVEANHYRTPRGAAGAGPVLVGTLDAGSRRALARWVMECQGVAWHEGYSLSQCRDGILGGSLAKRRLGWTAEEAADLLRSSRHGHAVGHPEEPSAEGIQEPELRFALPALEHLSDADLSTLLPDLRTIVADLDAGRLRITGSMGKTGPRRFQALLDRVAPPEHAALLPPDFLGGVDDFGANARTKLADILADQAAVPLLLHCTTVTSVRATATWQRQCRELAAAYPRAVEALVRVLDLVLGTRVVRTEDFLYGYVFLTTDNSAFVRGAVWAYAALAGADSAPLLGDVAAYCGRKDLSLPGSMIDGPVANSAVAALGALDGAAALDQLRRVRDMARHRTFQKSVAAALDAAALRSGLTREQVIERGVPDHGLDASGRFTVAVGPGDAASIVVDPDGSAAIEYVHAGAVVRSLPANLRDACASEIKALKARLKEVQGTLRAERDRIEAALATDRTWAAPEWAAYCLAPPLTGVHARRLIWEAAPGPDGPWTAGLPVRAGEATSLSAWRLRSADGTEHEIGAEAVIRLWHPVHASVADIEAWRDALTDTAYRQPFKQAFRELYLLTPAEEATQTYSNRFAGHILRYGQAKALTVARGWTGLSLGDWSSGMSGEAVREFPGTPWRARFFLENATSGDPGVAELCATDQVRFEQRVGRAWQPADLAAVPVRLLSEAFRDVDLFVGVASIGADPRWTDRGDDRHAAYWQEYSFGAVPESAAARRHALARLLPRTRIADRVEIGDRFVRVRGDLRTYKIHLGSGNILMEPDDAYLCIVDARSKDAGRLFLPFEEGGGVLSLIVSKAFLLADDRKITDRSILRQIRR